MALRGLAVVAIISGLSAAGCMSVPTDAGAATTASASSACPSEWIASTEGLAELPDVSEDLLLPTTNTEPPTEKEKARASYVVQYAEEWCTAHTFEVEHAYVVDPNPATLYWLGQFLKREGRDGPAHAAISKFLRGPYPNEEWRKKAETDLARLDQRTSRIGIVCDGRAELDQVWDSYGHTSKSPFPLTGLDKRMTCPARSSFRISKSSLAYELVATAPGCPPVKTRVGPNQQAAVFRLR
jgi:hypothetical protein